MKKLFYFIIGILVIIPIPIFGKGYIGYDSTTLWNGNNKYLYNLPTRYIGSDSGQFVRMLVWHGNNRYETYTDRNIFNNVYVGDMFRNHLLTNNQNLFQLVTDEFYYHMYDDGYSPEFSNQRYIGLMFHVGETPNTTDDQFYNPTTIKKDGFYNFDFDIYMEAEDEDGWIWNNMVTYNNQGMQCHHINSVDLDGNSYDKTCWVDRYSGTYYQVGTTKYVKTTYHVKHGKFMPDEYVDNMPDSVKGSMDSTGVFNNEYIYLFDSPFQKRYSQVHTTYDFKFWVSAPYNIRYWSDDSNIFINGTRVTNTDDYNFALKCYGETCDAGKESSILEQIFATPTLNLHGLGSLLDLIVDFFDMFLTEYHSSHGLDITFNIRGHNILFNIPSGQQFWNNNPFLPVYNIIISGLVAYCIFMKYYHELLRIANPNYMPTNKELMNL